MTCSNKHGDFPVFTYSMLILLLVTNFFFENMALVIYAWACFKNPTDTILPHKLASYQKIETLGVILLQDNTWFWLYKHRKQNTANHWNCINTSWSVLQAITDDNCNAAASGSGSGICGFNSYCIVWWGEGVVQMWVPM